MYIDTGGIHWWGWCTGEAGATVGLVHSGRLIY